MPEYAFDIDLSAAVRINAANPAEARKKLRGFFDCADCNAGELDGKTITFEASLIEGTAHLYEIDGVEIDERLGDEADDEPELVREREPPDGDDAMRNRIDRELSEGK